VDLKPVLTPPLLAFSGIVVLNIAEEILGTPIARRSDKEIRVWNAAGFASTGVFSYYAWKAALTEGVDSWIKVIAGGLGTLAGVASVLGLLGAVLPGPFVRSRSDITLVMSRGVPKVVFKGKG